MAQKRAVDIVRMYKKQIDKINEYIDEIRKSQIPLLSEFSSKGGVRLNLACGNHDKKGWINVDLFKYKGINALWDISQPLPFEDNSVLAINLGNSIKHLKMSSLKDVIGDYVRVLKVGGEIAITFYDFGLIAKHYQTKQVGINYINTMLYGAEFKENQIHSLVFDREWIMSFMKSIGCEPVGEKTVKWVVSILFKKMGREKVHGKRKRVS